MSSTTADQIKVTLMKLRKARAEAENTFSKISEENDRAARKAKTVSERVDTAAYLINMFRSLGGLAADANKALKLSGEVLERHNKAVLSKFAKGSRSTTEPS
jgi:hypothetical protein